MPRIDALPDDQRAVLSLVLTQSRSYAEIAALLRLDEQAVRQRAHAALAALGPREGTPPPAHRVAELSDYLLGQQAADEAGAARSYLSASAAGRVWARVVSAELRPLAGDRLPEIPAAGSDGEPEGPAAAAPPATAAPGSEDPPAAAPARQAAAVPPEAAAMPPEAAAMPPGAAAVPPGAAGAPRPPSSRRAGAALLGAVALAGVIVLIVVLAGGGGGNHRARAANATGATGPTRVVGQVNLVPPIAGGHALGVATIVAQGAQQVLAVQAQGLTPTSSRLAYAVWLYNSHADAERIGFAPPVTANGRLAAVAPLPADSARFRAIIFTRETSAQSTRPGQIVLAGRIPGH